MSKKMNTEDCMVNKKLVIYSAVAAAAITMAPKSEATVIYSGLKNIVLENPGLGSFNIDVNGDGTNNFTIVYNTGGTSFTVARHGDSANANVLHVGGIARILSNNYQLTAGRTAWGSTALLANATGGGNFENAQGYLGVQFRISGNTHYGWIEFSANAGGTQGTIHGWAYEDTQDTAIFTGDGKPEPGTLLSLALGLGAATFAWRKKARKQKKINQ